MKMKKSDLFVSVAFTLLLLFYWAVSSILNCNCDTSWLVGG